LSRLPSSSAKACLLGFRSQVMQLTKIVSGGQSGVDRAALDAALRLQFPCGGWCPRGRLAEDGPIPPEYPLVEMPSASYPQRTIQNVVDSDGTLIIYFGRLRGGTEQTMLHCVKRRKPYKLIDGKEVSPGRAAQLAAEFVEACELKTLNVAGPRASQAAEGYAYTLEAVQGLLLLQKGAHERSNGDGRSTVSNGENHESTRAP
jgi:hypothetical protein